MIMKEFPCSKLEVTPQFSHAVVNDELLKKMIRGVDESIVKYIFTNNCECVDSIKNEFNECVKIIGLPLTETENEIFSTLKRYGKVYDVIQFDSDNTIDNTISNIKEKINELNKNMNNLFSGGFFIMNPPYQGNNTNQIYPKFWKLAIESGVEQVSMIFPSKWQEPTNGSGLSLMNTKEIKEDRRIVYINNISNVFEDIPGAADVNIILWRKNFDNGLNGSQRILTDGKNEQIKKLYTSKDDIIKCSELTELVKIVKSYDGFESMCDEISYNKPYNLRTNFLDDPEKYGYEKIDMSGVVYIDEDYEIQNDKKIHIYGKYKGRNCFIGVDDNFKLNKKEPESFSKYKVFIPKNWGNRGGKYGEYGGSYSPIVIGYPCDICTEMYIESGCFDTLYEAKCNAKYIMSRFLRFLLLDNKFGIYNCKEYWKSIPKQDYKEDWWQEDDISVIDNHLFEKYSIPENIREFIRKNVQEKTVYDIRNYFNITNISKKIIKPKIKNEENIICTLW